MTRSLRMLAFYLFIAVSLAMVAPAADADYKIAADLMKKLSDDEQAAAPFFVVFGERPSLSRAHHMRNRAERSRFVVQALRETAERSQAGVRGYLSARRVTHTPFWVENKVYVRKGSLALARALAQRPEVVAILPEVIYTIPRPQVESGAAILSLEWGVSRIRADQVWSSYGTRGAGLVVANIDTGVQYDHPALVRQYRGNTGAGYSHAGNWRDPSSICGSAAPCDNNGHGSHTMGTMLGDDGLGNQIGVAPEARWIACKGCESNSCSGGALITCAQWVMDPNGDLSGADQPDVVNNSWGGGSGSSWYQSYVQNWRAAGIFPAFSNGNSGPGCGTAGSPGDYPESFSSGATSSSDAIASFSSRGPSAFGGILKPDISAPGVSVRSSVPTNSYAWYSGTSMASPHTAGAVALLWAARPGYRSNTGGTEALLRANASIRTTTETCGGVPAGASPNNTYGYGLLDVKAAADAAGAPPNQPPVVDITEPLNGASFPCGTAVAFAATATDPEDGTLVPSWTDNSAPLGPNPKTYSCTETGNHTIVASATDSDGAAASDSITISVYDPNIPTTPGNLTASVSGNTVTLRWSDSQNETNYRLERKQKAGKGWTNWQPVTAAIPQNATSYADSGLARGSYQHRLFAVNSSSGKESAPAGPVSSRVR